MKKRLVTVFGGTGFLGRRVTRHLLAHGFDIRVASRHPARADTLFAPAEVEAVKADIHDEASVAAALEHAHGAVNAVSLYVERGGATFRSVHVEGAARVARNARKGGIERLIHVSGIGSDPASSSDYIRARGEGEIAVREEFADAIIVRPAVMIGPDDAFLTAISNLVRRLPVYPLFGRGKTRLQPVHVEDVAEGIGRLLEAAPIDAGRYEFSGPRTYTYRELVQSVATELGSTVRLVPVPFALWRVASIAGEWLPGTPLTRNQIALMQRDNVAAPDAPGLPELAVERTPVEDVVREMDGARGA